MVPSPLHPFIHLLCISEHFKYFQKQNSKVGPRPPPPKVTWDHFIFAPFLSRKVLTFLTNSLGILPRQFEQLIVVFTNFGVSQPPCIYLRPILLLSSKTVLFRTDRLNLVISVGGGSKESISIGQICRKIPTISTSQFLWVYIIHFQFTQFNFIYDARQYFKSCKGLITKALLT